MKPLTFRRASRIVWESRWRAIAVIMLPVNFLATMPSSAWASVPDNDPFSNLRTPTNVHINKTVPKLASFVGVQIPNHPSDSEITCSHAFQEPLIPLGSATDGSQNDSLGAAIKAYTQREKPDDLSSLSTFIQQHPESPWRPSLDLNIADLQFKVGNFSKALEAWEDAWARTQYLKDKAGQDIANIAVGKLAEMKARIGRTEELDTLFNQIKGRDISGPAAQLLVQARSGLWLMKNHPEEAFRCGPSALQELSLAVRHKIDHPNLIKQSRSTPEGIALSDVQKLSSKINMPMQMAKRTSGSSFIVPAVIHWRLGHYAALVGKDGNRYIVHDTTFGGARFSVSAETLESETSGYFLVPTGPLPKGWVSVADSEGRKVLGRGNPGDVDGYGYSPNDKDSGNGDCGSGGTVPSTQNPDATVPKANNSGDQDETPNQDMVAMTEPYVKAMLVSLNLVDTPARYAPPVGPTMHFTVQYNQREIAQPYTFTYATLGPDWTFSYSSHVTPNYGYANIYERGGGVEMYYYNYTTNSYNPAQRSQAALVQVNSTTWKRTLPGGEMETFGVPDGAGNFFLSQITDPQGNSLTLTYDAHLRLIALTDATGQVTMIHYVSDTVGNASFYNISRVTDPFSRSANFAYDAIGRLTSITDILGIQSQFTYLGSSSFINSLVTPYGKTTFSFGDNSTDPSLGTTRWLNTTYPDGNTSRTEYNQTVPVPNSDPNGIPTGMYSGISTTNDYMQFRNTYYWDKQAMKSFPGLYTNAEITHWLHTSDINTCADIEESIKKVHENRIWFAYGDGSPGQSSSIQATDTMIAKPTQRGRVIGSGSSNSSNTQLFQYQYNSIGNVTQEIDPLGRETDYTYATNGIDVTSVSQKKGASADLLSSATYNNQHETLSTTDTSGQTTHYTYFPNGQLNTVTNPKGQITTNAYNASGYVTSVTGPVPGAVTTFTYDGFGRIQTVTDSQGYKTRTDYDAMDRPVLFTYPDGTTSQIAYQNLDISYTRDRLGRVVRHFYNAIRQPIEVFDNLGNVTTFSWSLSAGLSSARDASGHSTTWIYDTQNRPIEKDYSDGSKQMTAYEGTTSRILSNTDNMGQVATNSYNMDNSIANVTYTHATVATPTVSYTYDPSYPRLTTVSDPATGTITYNYNPVSGSVGSNMLGGVTTPLTTVGYSYDELGRQTSQTVGGLASSVTYDTLGRVVTATNPLTPSGSFTYSYLNNTSRVTSLTNPNGQSTIYSYLDSTATPNEPLLAEIKNLNASSTIISKFDYAYDAQAQITSWTQQTDNNHPQVWANRFDGAGRLGGVAVTDGVTGSILHQYAYLYDATGNRTSEQVDGNVTGASYNGLNQITGQTAGGKMVFSGSTGTVPSMVTVGGSAATVNYSTNFSGTANVSSGTNNVPIIAHDVNGNTSTNTYQVVIPPVSASYSYDLNGNLLSDGPHTFAWNAKNEIVSIVYNSGANAGNHTEFTYNGLGQRVKIVERAGTVIGSGTITSTKQYSGNEEFDASNTVTKRYFSQGEQRISAGVTRNLFYTRDHLGSIRELLDSTGTIQARYSYDPFGRATQVSGSIQCDFQFAGMYAHSTSGLNLTNYRTYNPNTGSWISRDPKGERGGSNLYEYCGDNPINFVDTSGLDRTDAQRTSQFIHGAIGIGVAILSGIAFVGVVTGTLIVSAPILGIGLAVIAGSTLIFAGFYGLMNMAAAFSPDTPEGERMSKIAEEFPETLNEYASLIITGKKDVGKTADEVTTATTGEALDRILDAIDDILDDIDEMNKLFPPPPAQNPVTDPYDTSNIQPDCTGTPPVSNYNLTPDGRRM